LTPLMRKWKIKMTEFSKIDDAILNSVNRMLDKLIESGEEPTNEVFREIMSDPEVQAAFDEMMPELYFKSHKGCQKINGNDPNCPQELDT
jgi:hypothetical protein